MNDDHCCVDQDGVSTSSMYIDTEHDRRSFLSACRSGAAAASALSTAWITGAGAALADDDEAAAGESIASRAARLSKVVVEEQTQALEEAEIASPTTVPSSPAAEGGGGAPADTRSMYDFALPMQGFDTPMTDLLGRSDQGDDGAKKQPKVVLFVNIKQDDVVARKNIPELIALASKFGREGDFAVVCSPTDQGYYEVRVSWPADIILLSLVGMNSLFEFDVLFLTLFHFTFVFMLTARHLPAHSAEAGPGIRIRDQPRHHRYR